MLLGGLLVPVVGAVDPRPRWPRVVVGALIWRTREELKVGDRLGAVPEGGADAVGARVAAADDDDMLAVGVDVAAVVLAGQHAVLVRRVGEEARLVLREVLHGEVHAVNVAAGDGQVVGHGGADGEDGGVEAVERAVRASLPTSTPHWNEMPSSSMSLTRRATASLSSFMFGIP